MIFGKLRWLFHPPIAKKMRNFQHQVLLEGYCHGSTDSWMSVTSQEVGDVTVRSSWWRHENLFPIFFEKWKSLKEFQQSSQTFFFQVLKLKALERSWGQITGWKCWHIRWAVGGWCEMGHLACSWRTNGMCVDLGEQNRHPEFEFMDVEKSLFHSVSC